MSAQPAKVTRPENLLAPPVRLETAFDDPEGVLALIRKGAPYKTLAAVHRHPDEGNTGGWFRNFWALGGKVVFEGAEPFFNNPRFIEAAKQSFGAQVVRPVTMMTNLNLPMDGLPAHLDLPFFRGMTNRQVPSWMLEPMGYSGLFQEWAIPVASAITWFYDGEGGDFEYWPDGPQAPSRTERPPYSNRAVVADNEYMYHRVGATGAPSEFCADDAIPYGTTLEHGHDGRWRVRNGGETLAKYDHGKVRLSVLWKAYCFETEAAAASYEDHSHDLTADMVTAIFADDLRTRGIAFTVPRDITTDPAWKQVLNQAYPAPPVAG